jgi:hypothetical protein
MRILLLTTALTLAACGGSTLSQPPQPQPASSREATAGDSRIEREVRQQSRNEVAEPQRATAPGDTFAANPSGIPLVSPLDAPVANR